MTWRQNATERVRQWKAEHPEAVAEQAHQKRLQRQRAARQRRLAKALGDDEAVQLYRAEKKRRSA